MTRLVNDLMTLARMDSGQAPLQLEDLDLSDVTVEAVERMTPLAERRHVTLEMGDMPELGVCGDRQYLIQTVSNLVENAIKYAGADQKVRIETGQVRNGKGDMAVLRVTDTGPGIPPEHLPRLFDRFYRVDQARARDPEFGRRRRLPHRHRSGPFHRGAHRPAPPRPDPRRQQAQRRLHLRSHTPSERLRVIQAASPKSTLQNSLIDTSLCLCIWGRWPKAGGGTVQSRTICQTTGNNSFLCIQVG